MNLCLFSKGIHKPFLQLKAGLILLWRVLWSLFFVFCKRLSNHFFTTIYLWKRACLKYGKEKVWHALKVFAWLFWNFLWVLECFNHSVKTMPCNLAVQRPFTQPTHYSKAGIHSSSLQHQRSSKIGFMKLGVFINMIPKWSPCWRAQSSFRNSHKFSPLWIFSITCCKMLYHQFVQRLIYFLKKEFIVEEVSQ